ncbi:hypothetical protein [Eubacterium aggregans]|uniref:hypothetical protein n=1 Tax=Eubacterium aggregans TaxID=81409 RepID=UPI003F3D13DB
MEDIQASEQEKIKEVFVLDEDRKNCESEETNALIVEYLEDENSRKLLATIPGVFTWYTDGIYYWEKGTAEIVKKKSCGFAYGFVDRVLKK